MTSTEEVGPALELREEEEEEKDPMTSDAHKGGAEDVIEASGTSPRQRHLRQLPWGEALKSEPWSVPAPDPKHFTRFRADWGERRRVLIVRFLLAAYMTVWLSISISVGAGDADLPDVISGPLNFGWKWVIYLTDWSLCLLVLYLWCAWAAAAVLYKSPACMKFVWVLRNVTSLAAVLVTALFWTLLFPAIGHTNLEDVHCHAVNTVVVLIDLALSPLPFYFRHGYQGLTYLLVYLVFSVVYWGAGATDPDGNHYIYPPLNYHHPWLVSTLLVFTTLILLPLLNLALFAWSRLFERLALRRMDKLREGADEQVADLERPMI